MFAGSRTYKMVAGIIVAYVVCWFPFYTVQFIQMISLRFCHSAIVKLVQLITAEIGVVNSGINFIIYAWMNEDFRLTQCVGIKIT